MTDRLIQACTDARDTVTRATALHAQHWHEAAYPTRPTQVKVTLSKPESRPPAGDLELHTTLRATGRAIAAAQAELIAADIPIDPPDFAQLADAPPSLLVVHTLHVARCLAWVEAHHADLDEPRRRRVFAACRHARASLAAWDTPVETDDLRDAESDQDAVAALRETRAEHGTFVAPPKEFAKTAHIPRCPECRHRPREARDGGRGGWRVTCETCRKAKRDAPRCVDCDEVKTVLEAERRDGEWVWSCEDCREERRQQWLESIGARSRTA